MNVQNALQQLMSLADNSTKMETARGLTAYTNDAKVMDVLCTAAVYTDHHGLREVLLDVLKTNPAGAFVRFSDYALWSRDPVARKHALVNLSLMGCRDAKDAVISGLYDPDASVQRAAAMHAGLYEDETVRKALERYFENHRLAFARTFFADGLRSMRDRPGAADDRFRAEMDEFVPLPASSKTSP